MADAAECIVIGVDNSRWVPPDSDIFQNLCDAIEFYCRAKFKENPDTFVGIYTIGSSDSRHLVYPTRSIEDIVAKFPCMNAGCGQVDLLGMFSFGCMPLVERFGQHSHKKKWLLVFVGGLTNLSMLFAGRTARTFNSMGISIDVIHFYKGETPKYPFSSYPCGRTELEAFIKLCNGYDNGKHRFVHVESRSFCGAVFSLLKITPLSLRNRMLCYC